MGQLFHALDKNVAWWHRFSVPSLQVTLRHHVLVLQGGQSLGPRGVYEHG